MEATMDNATVAQIFLVIAIVFGGVGIGIILCWRWWPKKIMSWRLIVVMAMAILGILFSYDYSVLRDFGAESTYRELWSQLNFGFAIVCLLSFLSLVLSLATKYFHHIAFADPYPWLSRFLLRFGVVLLFSGILNRVTAYCLGLWTL